MSWTPELVKELKRLWKKGLTTSEIGRRIGISKNAVVGKAHRLWLEGRPSPIKRDTSGQPKPVFILPESFKNPKLKEASPKKEDVLMQVYRRTKKEKPQTKKGVKLVDLKPNSCRWPSGDPKDLDFNFCGKEVVPGKSYCEEHCAVAYSGVFKAK